MRNDLGEFFRACWSLESLGSNCISTPLNVKQTENRSSISFRLPPLTKNTLQCQAISSNNLPLTPSCLMTKDPPENRFSRRSNAVDSQQQDWFDVVALVMSTMTTTIVCMELTRNFLLSVATGLAVCWITNSLSDLTRKYSSRGDRVFAACAITAIATLVILLCCDIQWRNTSVFVIALATITLFSNLLVKKDKKSVQARGGKPKRSLATCVNPTTEDMLRPMKSSAPYCETLSVWSQLLSYEPAGLYAPMLRLVLIFPECYS